MKKAYIAKKGQNSLTSKDKSIDIKPNGGLYDGVDISTKAVKDLKDLKVELKEDLNTIDKELVRLDKKIVGKMPVSENLEEIDKTVTAKNRTLSYVGEILPELKEPQSIPNKAYIDTKVTRTYDKIEKRVRENEDNILEIREDHFQDIGNVNRELAKHEEELKGKHPLSENLKDVDKVVFVENIDFGFGVKRLAYSSLPVPVGEIAGEALLAK